MNTIKLSKMLSVVLVVAWFTALGTAFSQVSPAAQSYEGQPPFTIGAAASNFDADWGKNRIWGPTFWGQWHPWGSGALAGLGVDAEVRDLDYGRGDTLPSNFKQVTFAGGPIYTVRAFQNFQPYGKYLFGFGSFDFMAGVPNYTHDTRNIYAPGFGFQVRLYHHLWARADWEYQFWPDLFGGRTADPQGFTLGFSYDFRPHLR